MWVVGSRVDGRGWRVVWLTRLGLKYLGLGFLVRLGRMVDWVEDGSVRGNVEGGVEGKVGVGGEESLDVVEELGEVGADGEVEFWKTVGSAIVGEVVSGIFKEVGSGIFVGCCMGGVWCT